ncbi:hypothetical protein [Alkaliphilus peptidifermentans]|uniref:Uncharacterized protein n=1 Tax=Alkaliphilus peptidifermentans DSM 18978 TaxID=1120976 RepID=A0A1G5APW1_9FIRM|nr:hypothetical protein [Alkaliphilus peptidifermentans]SCX79924.1 hypothetical protein SAMN03080606_00240 [Alkaliphilus peptidifermentans DSM 18978]
MKDNQIKTLKDFIITYGNQKSDMEISHMFNISVDQVKSERNKIDKNNFKNLTGFDE